MRPDEIAKTDRLAEDRENVRQARRRDRALLNSPAAAPSRYPKKELRRLYREAREELTRR